MQLCLASKEHMTKPDTCHLCSDGATLVGKSVPTLQAGMLNYETHQVRRVQLGMQRCISPHRDKERETKRATGVPAAG